MERNLQRDVEAWIEAALQSLRGFSAEFLELSVLIQLGVIALCLALSIPIGGAAERALETRIRKVRGKPRLLRLLALLLRRTKWLVAAILLGVALVGLRAAWRSGDAALVAVALYLTAAWIVISVVSRLIRNRTLGRLVAWIAWILVALQITELSEPVAGALDALAITIGEVRISAWLLLKALLLIGLFLWAAIALGKFAERQVARSADLTPSFRVLVGKLIQIALLVAAGGIALSLLGIDLTALTFLAGALGLGIGFGLQKVVSNFVSGLIILVDKSIKPGDTIAVGETFGWVKSLRARYVEVITRDGREYLIPNEDFITERVENWSYADTRVRIDVEFGVSYESDPHEVRRLAVEAAKSVSRVVEQPQSVCHLTGLGESSLDFILRFWIRDPQNGVTNVRGAVLLACWDAFKAADISFPFPHRQIVMDQPLNVRLDRSGTGFRD